MIDKIEYDNYKENSNYKISAILELVKEKYPDVNEKELIDILNAETTTEKPSLRSSFVMPRPMPLLEPVTTATIFSPYFFSISIRIFVLFSFERLTTVSSTIC